MPEFHGASPSRRGRPALLSVTRNRPNVVPRPAAILSVLVPRRPRMKTP
ncbi:hypothetical protein C882_0737 [Caenispirillum salinarum AK4]|uniref:Uncharacterized protein n=1 Tax=Caenispirillum salinarum AK4 TaxID=1238182 RepID=K9HEN7_9PROT|nr:hypothetical protein C882_0737 [Caenispirillum salinarum AK4]